MRHACLAIAALLAWACATPATQQAEDVQVLLRLHESGMQAHRDSDIEALLAPESDDYVVSSRGEISRPVKSQRREFLGRYLAATRFSVYRDQVPPVVKVSPDRTLGWVIVQIEAKGEQRTASGQARPLEFVSSWIELYEKRDGRWLRVGNVSNFK